MKIFDKALSAYVRQVGWGLCLLAVVAVVRFLLLPVFGIPYSEGTDWASLTVVMPVLVLLYSVLAARRGAGFRDILGISAVIGLSGAFLIILGIAVDDFAGIDSYYTDPAHGGGENTLGHMAAHLVVGVIFSLALWGLGTVTYLVAGGRRGRLHR